MNYNTKKKLEDIKYAVLWFLLLAGVIFFFAFKDGHIDLSSNKKLATLFSGSFPDLNNASIPLDFMPTGDKAFSYDLDKNMYSYRYVPKEMQAENADEVRYIILFQVTEYQAGEYVQTSQKSLRIGIIDTISKKVITSNSFAGNISKRPNLPKTSVVMDWIRGELQQD
jgi:hypothetical protein